MALSLRVDFSGDRLIVMLESRRPAMRSRAYGIHDPATRGEAMDTVELVEEDSDEESGYVNGPLMTIGEAARYIGASRKTVYSLIERGRLSALKGKRSVKLVSRESLEEFRSSGELT